MGVKSNAEALRHMEETDSAWHWHEVALRVFCIDTTFYGITSKLNVILLDR